MKAIISVLVESPFYFTLSLRDRYRLVKRLADNEKGLDLTVYHRKIDIYLKEGELPD